MRTDDEGNTPKILKDLQNNESITVKILENVVIITMYCHLRPPDAIAFRT